jgi:hypothetical protein
MQFLMHRQQTALAEALAAARLRTNQRLIPTVNIRVLDEVLLGRQRLPAQLAYEAVTSQMNAIDVALQVKVRCEGLGALGYSAYVSLGFHYY